MSPRDVLTMLLLAGIWGGSFLFLKIVSPALGPVAVAGLRVAGAAMVLAPLVLWRGHGASLRPVWRMVLLSSLISCVLPFMGLSWAAQRLPAGPLSVLNATTPMWGALVGWFWHREPLGPQRVVGLTLGFAGVAWLAHHRAPGELVIDPQAVAVALASTLMYAIAVHHSKQHLRHLPPMALSAGLLSGATLMLLPATLWLGPQPMHSPDLHAHWSAVRWPVWAALAALAVFCTGWAYAIFYRLIERVGPSRALNVTFLIPPFGMLWGWLWLDERVTGTMLLSASIIVAGTFMSSLQLESPSKKP
jgi:drug/metabolite transporter (DMT)-like permease